MAEDRSHRGEMPFLDHLEELRWRILWSLLAVGVGVVIGFFIVQHYNVLGLIKRPIVPYLPDGRLYVTRPTDAFLITLKLAALVGLVLAAPVIIWQIWLFLSPALYQREKRFIIPTMAAGLILFTVGITIAYLWVLPAALRMLITFQRSDLQPIFTAEEYFSFATQVIFAFGAMFELPLVIVLLAVFGLVNPAFFQRHRPIALVIAAIAAAFLTPPDAFSMLMLLAPLMGLYEGGIIVARIIWKRRAAQTIAAVVVAFLLLAPGHAWAQQPRPVVPKPTAGQVQRLPSDSLPAPPHDTTGGPLDTATARKLGLPTAPSRSFPAPDSVMQALLALPGFNPIRYAADSLVLHADSQSIDLVGHALVKQDVSTLEADTVQFAQRDCRLAAAGLPALFNQGTVLIGNRMHYNTCEQYGVVDEALTSFNQSGVDWFLRGGLRVDSASTRIYAGGGDVTSCDLPEPHYHFEAGKVKWVTNTILVARPAVLYVRDVPVLWLPFMFQDMHPGRKSGILVPHFGINDLVRPNRGYRRHITNVGYYLALSDYVGAEFWLDWYAGNYYSLNGQVRYKWRDRFLSGGLSVTRIYENGVNGAPGGRSLRLRWGHQQSFDMNTTLNASVDYATSASVVERNAVDPMLATATLASNINFTKRFSWGSFALGASRRQDLTNGSATQTLPSVALTPSAIRISNLISWSPSFSFTNQRQMHQPGLTFYPVPPAPGDSALPYDTLFNESRTTTMQIGTPVTIGQWTWQNSFSVTDQIHVARDTVSLADPSNPSDTTRLVYGQNFSTGIDWNTGISLPTLFAGSWKLQPTLGIQNTTGGPFILRNRNTKGAYVHQGKRFSLGVSLSPTFFGFFPGIGPLARIRHSITPLIRWNFAPSASVPEAYAAARAGPGKTPLLTSPTQQSVSIGLSQVIEGKFRPAPGDTTGGRNARKLKILSIQTSPITYDFEQAKEPGRTGWQTQSITNSLQSDLLPGFSLTLQHNLWNGPVGTDSAKFSPFLSNVSARFTLSQSTLEDLLGLFTGSAPTHETATGPAPDTTTQRDLIPQTPGTSLNDLDRGTTRAQAHQPFTASFTYDDQRYRASDSTSGPRLPNRTLGVSFSFNPTRNWALSWSTQYNLTTHQFGQHIIRLERNLHRWKATFQFLKSPNGNFAFNFFISLLDEPDIRFQYQQQTLQQ